MIGYWNFNEGSGMVISDLSGLANHGTLQREQPDTWTAGVLGNGLFFDGSTGAFVEVPTSSSLENISEISFSAWAKPVNPNLDAPIIAKEGPGGDLSYWFGVFLNDFGMLLDADGNQSWSANDRDNGVIVSSEWTHVVSTWDGSLIRHYQDGNLVSSSSYSGTVNISDASLTIGINSGYDDRRFHGTLDEVYLYNHSLDAGEINALLLIPEPANSALICLLVIGVFIFRVITPPI